MAIFTNFRRLDMGRILAGRVGTIVAAGAIARDVHVIEIRRQPADSGVTVVAVVAADHVVLVLATGGHTVMTGTTGTHYLRVIDGESGDPYIRRVAVFTNVAGLNMSWRLACSFHAVVAAYAVPRDIHVVKIGRKPADRRMTVIACVAAVDMSRMLARRGEPVMAGAAGA